MNDPSPSEPHSSHASSPGRGSARATGAAGGWQHLSPSDPSTATAPTEPLATAALHDSWADSRPALPRRWRWVPVAALVVLALIGFAIHEVVERSLKETVAQGLVTIRDGDVSALELWIETRFQAVEVLALDEEVVAEARALVAVAAGAEDARLALLAADGASHRDHDPDVPCSRLGSCQYVLASLDGTILASPRPELVGYAAPAGAGVDPGEVAAGPVLGLPFQPLVPGRDAAGRPVPAAPVMFVATAVRDAAGEPIAVVGLPLDPATELTAILRRARKGRTGQTYAFDGGGRMISASRFDDELRAAGLLPDRPDATSLLQLEVRDPGVDLTRGGRPAARRSALPLTRAVADAVAGGTGVDVDGYRDVRGVPVVGAWTWLDAHGFGVVSEVGRAEALAPLDVLRMAFFGLFGVLVAASLWALLARRKVAVMRHRMEGALDLVEQLGQYTLEGKLGEGGMGVVYRARHVLLRRPTALKLLSPERNTEEDIRRFEREVRLTSRLSHPNTIAIWDYGYTPDRVFYYAMELLDGITMAQLVEEAGPLPEGRVIHLLVQACGSLQEAHDQGLVHRDIKPANLFVGRQGGIDDHVKVLDFGLVKNVRGDSVVLTAPDLVAGTPLYVAPEAIESADVDHRVDLYALGIVAYLLLTGSEPFRAGSLTELLAQHVHATPEPPSKRRGRPVCAHLESVVLAALSKSPGARPGSAREMAARLRACASAGTWTDDDARAWWEARDRRPSGTAAREDAGSASAVTIELGRRE